jgi:hypothetical protein
VREPYHVRAKSDDREHATALYSASLGYGLDGAIWGGEAMIADY